MVLEPGRVQGHRAGGLDRRLHVGEHERQSLVVDDPLAEGLALLGVRDRVVERALRETGGDGGCRAGRRPGR